LTTNIHCSQTFASPLQVCALSFISLYLRPAFARRSRAFIRRCHLRTKKPNCQRSNAGSCRAPAGLVTSGVPDGKRQNLLQRLPVVNGHSAIF